MVGVAVLPGYGCPGRAAAADADGRVCYIGGTVSRPKLSGLCLGALQLGGMVPKIFYVEPYPRHPSRPDHHLPCLRSSGDTGDWWRLAYLWADRCNTSILIRAIACFARLYGLLKCLDLAA